MNLNCFELFYATYVNTAECSYTFISLSLSLCCLHLFLAVFMEKLASLVSRCFKITLSVSPLSNKNAALIRLFTMKNKTFFQFASLAVCTLLFPSCYTYVYLVFSAWACLVGLYQGFHLRPEAGGRTFCPVVCHSASGTLRSILAIFFYYCIIYFSY